MHIIQLVIEHAQKEQSGEKRDDTILRKALHQSEK
jgi:hypothetical protein